MPSLYGSLLVMLMVMPELSIPCLPWFSFLGTRPPCSLCSTHLWQTAVWERWGRYLLASLPEKEPCSLALEGAQLGGPAQSPVPQDSSIISPGHALALYIATPNLAAGPQS